VPFAFGEGSFKRHIALATNAGVRVQVVRLPGAALDVDVPEDFRLFRDSSSAARGVGRA
jgi:2-phospho-L-lactate guanylyltransferase (CobY/MobA/RfbA family)